MQKTAYEVRISDWSSDVCSSDLDAQRHPVGDQWDVDRAFQRAVVKAAISAFDIAAQIVGRRLRADQHRAAQRVAAEQRALWALQHLEIGRASCRERGWQYVEFRVDAA